MILYFWYRYSIQILSESMADSVEILTITTNLANGCKRCESPENSTNTRLLLAFKSISRYIVLINNG